MTREEALEKRTCIQKRRGVLIVKKFMLIDLEAKTDAESLISNTCNLLAKHKRINFYFDPDSGTDQVEALDEDA